jgi:NAD(P)-dependent dehydrogenase (short-subunit alcohol dehydrogenase family)
MEIAGSVALVTGANRGIGRQYAVDLVERGATVWAAARRPETIDLPGVRTLRLDITDPASVAAAAELASDVSLLVNNAGIATMQNLVTGDLDLLRLEMETHFFGTLHMIRAFAPVLAANGGGAVLNMLSALSYVPYDGANGYSAAKAAQWRLVDAARSELAGQGTQVTGVYVAAVDTDMMAGSDVDKLDPADVTRVALDAVVAGAAEVLVDEGAKGARAALAAQLAVPTGR